MRLTIFLGFLSILTTQSICLAQCSEGGCAAPAPYMSSEGEGPVLPQQTPFTVDYTSEINSVPVTPDIPVPQVSMPGATTCPMAAASTQSECGSVTGIGAIAAQGINTAAGSVTIINQAPPTANANCSAAEYTALANNAGTAISATTCYIAYNSCSRLCVGDQQSLGDTCASQFSAFRTKLLMATAQGAMQVALALKCKNATNPTTPVIPGGPGYQGPQVQDPNNKGLQALAPGAPKGPDSQATDGMSGSPAVGGAAYPGGAPATNQAKNEASGITAPTLGLTGGSGGGGWPTGTAGAGNPAGAGAAAPFDLSALLPGHAGDPARGPASVANEVTGANDLSNFQKVTRMMNKKRPVLKSGDGA